VLINIITKMKHSISITLSDEILLFLEKLASQYKVSKSHFIDKILKEYKKQTLAREFAQDAKNDTQKDLDFVNSDFSDFLNIIENEKSLSI